MTDRKTKKLKLLDTTLRDGSYLINFAFTAKQTAQITSRLDKCGIDMIEVGHGVGLNASKSGKGVAEESDEAYMDAAAESVNKSIWGMFAMPGICNLSHLDACLARNIGFLRFGINIDDFEGVLPYVLKAKAGGAITCVNFLKSYLRDSHTVEKAARAVIAEGADYVYIVDSAGSMFPSHVKDFCERVKDLPFGFHGHNNLGLAVANAVTAFECGADIIDCSLQGMGRSSGNTVSEQFVAIMQTMGMLEGIDLISLLDLSDELIKPLLRKKGHDGIDIICGYSGFHSSYINIIRKHAIEFNIDPRLLIVEVCKVTRENAPEEVVRFKAIELSNMNSNASYQNQINIDGYYGEEQELL